MKINVKHLSVEQDITITWVDENGDILECNHAGSTVETLDCGYPDMVRGDWVEDLGDFKVCDKCEYSKFIEKDWMDL